MHSINWRFILFLGLILGALPWPAARATDPIPAEELAASAVEQVSEQIRIATTQPSSHWASQPGAIRTFGAEGFPSRIYKLYSAARSIIGSNENPSDDVPAHWGDRPDDFIDLNAPVTNANATLAFPIVDPRASTGDASTTVEGFDYRADTEGVVRPGPDTDPDAQRLPMPVRWLYRLRDGTTGYLGADGRFLGVRPATLENPIVGRFAYWTDDETSKINVNTASEGVYWDIPRCDTTEERAYAERQPFFDEYQRLPGHPARVCLSSVLLPGQRWYLPGTTGALAAMRLEDLHALWGLSPYVRAIGSNGGTTVQQGFLRGLPLVMPGEPPYSGCLEMFNQSLAPGFPVSAATSGFFLTTSSRAPELNAFGRPRVSIWPSISASSAQMSPHYQILQPPATLNGIFAFRNSSDLVKHSNHYSGGSHLPHSYLRAQAGIRIPGHPRSLAEKYGPHDDQDTAQIVVECQDHSRAHVFLNSSAQRYSTASGQCEPTCVCGGSFLHLGLIRDPNVFRPRGLGRIPVISEVALQFICLAENGPDGLRGDPLIASRLPPGHKSIGAALLVETFCPTQGVRILWPAFTIKIADVSGGPAPPLILNEQHLAPFSSAPLSFNSAFALYPDLLRSGHPWGGQNGVGGLAGSPQPIEWTRKDYGNPAVSVGAVVPASAATLHFEGFPPGAPLVIEIHDAPGSSTPMQTLRLAFPTTGIPVPDYTDEAHDSFVERRGNGKTPVTNLIRSGDVIRSLVPAHGDYRLVLARRSVGTDLFQPHPDYFDGGHMAHSLTLSSGGLMEGGKSAGGFVRDASYPAPLTPDLPISPDSATFSATLPPSYRFSPDPGVTGDWDNGISTTPDGAYANKGDEGWQNPQAYFDPSLILNGSYPQYHSPYRVAPSPVVFGSLPTGAATGIPWRTLLFRPQPDHFGASDPPDHLWLDLFWMPKLTPHNSTNHANQEPFVSDGVINLNHSLAPFSYITRSTALHALLKPQKLLAIPTDAGPIYKSGAGERPWRHHLDPKETLRQWAGRFFRTASELCEMYLVPEGETLENMPAFWNAHRLTGDNTRERPYADLYGLVTTKSNSYTTHVIAQAIDKSENAPPDRLDHDRDSFSTPFRGTARLRRTLDSKDTRIPDYFQEPNAPSLDTLYRIDAQGFPAVEKEPFSIHSIQTYSGSGFGIQWNTVPGRCERIQFSTDLKTWTDTGGWINTTAKSMFTTVPAFDISGPFSVYFRVVRW